MPSFDIVSEVNKHELTNAIDQVNREISTRFDFKGVSTEIEFDEKKLIWPPYLFISKKSHFCLRIILVHDLVLPVWR